MKPQPTRRSLRCAIYTRVSTDQGLEQDFNSLDAQREASEAYVKSQAHEGWKQIRSRYDDGGFSGGSMDRPALRKLLSDVEAERIDVIVVYKVDRLTRSLADFAKLVELFDAHNVSFVSVTQSFNTTTSMGRLTLNVLLSFAQFEREVTGERIRDKIACGWAGWFLSATGLRTALCILSNIMLSSCAISFGAISKSGAWSGSSRSSTAKTSGFPSAPIGQADRLAGAF